jgi:hypothetical protein
MPFLPVLFAEATHAVTSDTDDVQVQACGLHFCIVPEQASPEAGLPRFGRKGVRVVPLPVRPGADVPELGVAAGQCGRCDQMKCRVGGSAWRTDAVARRRCISLVDGERVGAHNHRYCTTQKIGTMGNWKVAMAYVMLSPRHEI